MFHKHLLVTVITLLAGLQTYGQLPLPEMPASLTCPVDRADYLASHFYDAMDWNDTAMTSKDNLMQDWANFLSVLPHCTPQVRDSVIIKTIHNIPVSLIPTYSDMADGYLFATDSELCDETTYLKVLSALATHPGIDQAYRITLASRLDYLSRCAPGTQPADITVENLDGSTTCRLSELTGRAANILLVFYDPDCDDCHDTLNELATSPHWTTLQKSGTLIVVKAEITDETDALYPILTVPSLYHLTGTPLTVQARNLPLPSITIHTL